MDKNYLNFMLGVIVCSILIHVTKEIPEWNSILITSVITLIFTFNKLTEIVSYFLIISSVIFYPISWVMGTGRWWDVLIELFLIFVLYYSFHHKKPTKPLFVDYGDITRFPVETVPDNIYPIDY